jgi:DNA polymerase
MPAAPTLPGKKDIDACRRCPLWERATQGVPGEGPRRAHIMLVGEQPGDEEDLQGKPFVGPAGRLLRRAMAEAGISADDAYVTNAVKHFSWEPRGKRRIHKTPAQREIAACRDWLEAEMAAVKPVVIVTLGATALGAVLGKKMTITAARTATLTLPDGARLIATYHPSAVLRGPDEAARDELYRTLVADLKRAVRAAATK